MQRLIKPVALLSLVACEPLVIPIHSQLEVRVDLSEYGQAGAQLPPEGYDFDLSTGVVDIEQYRSYVPEGLRDRASFELGALRIGQPDVGPLDQWMTSLSVYLSKDGVRDDGDLLLGEVTVEEFAQEWVELPIDLPLEGAFGVIIVGNVKQIPSEAFTIPLEIDASAIVETEFSLF